MNAAVDDVRQSRRKCVPGGWEDAGGSFTHISAAHIVMDDPNWK
jgi:hypothetical protein